MKREEPYCALCGKLIDAWRSYPDPLSASVDHIVPASVDPSLKMSRANMRAAHLLCNQRRSTGRGSAPTKGLSVEDF